MQVNIQKFLKQAGIKDPFYPGKKLIIPCRQTGEYKSHCIVLDWRDPDKILLDVKPGLSSKDLEPAKLKKYPVSLQTPTHIEIEVLNDNIASAGFSEKDLEELIEVPGEHEDEQEESSSSSSSGGGSSKGQKKNLEEKSPLSLMNEAFSEVMEGNIPELAKVVEMIVMGTEIAAEAFEKVFDKLIKQISHAKVSPTELLAQAGKFLTKVQPPSFLEAKKDEKYDVEYKYDRLKNEDIGYRLG